MSSAALSVSEAVIGHPSNKSLDLTSECCLMPLYAAQYAAGYLDHHDIFYPCLLVALCEILF
jgi:hypothetical protein